MGLVFFFAFLLFTVKYRVELTPGAHCLQGKGEETYPPGRHDVLEFYFIFVHRSYGCRWNVVFFTPSGIRFLQEVERRKLFLFPSKRDGTARHGR